MSDHPNALKNQDAWREQRDQAVRETEARMAKASRPAAAGDTQADKPAYNGSMSERDQRTADAILGNPEP